MLLVTRVHYLAVAHDTFERLIRVGAAHRQNYFVVTALTCAGHDDVFLAYTRIREDGRAGFETMDPIERQPIEQQTPELPEIRTVRK